MTCRELADVLLEFISGELETQLHATIEQHLSICPHCDAVVHNYRVTIKITRKLPTKELPQQFAKRLAHLLGVFDEDSKKDAQGNQE
ncbi:MAG: anti-sigma factor family protein [Gemmataceae bacterium]